MKAKEWPNKLGHDVRVRHGVAEVVDMVRFLRVFAPIAPSVVWVRNRYVTTARYKTVDVPLGTDPVEAVRVALERGEIRVEK